MDNLTLQLSILTPKDTLFSGKVRSISSKNSLGKFDLLASHANFITIVENQKIDIIKDNNEKLKFKFSQAIIFLNSDKVTIYAEPRLSN